MNKPRGEPSLPRPLRPAPPTEPSLGPARLLGPLAHVVPACHHPRPREAPLQTCSLITSLCWSPSPAVGTFQTAQSHAVCSVGGGRVGREKAAAKRNEARLAFWR